MSDDEISQLSVLGKVQEESYEFKSFEVNSFFNDICIEPEGDINELKSSCSMQVSKSLLSNLGHFTINDISGCKENILENSDIESLSEISFEYIREKDVPMETWKVSEAITSAKGSFVGPKNCEVKSIISSTSFAMPSKMFCKNCQADVITLVRFREVPKGIWNSIESFLSYFKCCENDPNRIREEIVHLCCKCQKILAKISNE